MSIKISKQVVDNIQRVKDQGLDLTGYLKTLSLYVTPTDDVLLYDPQPTLRDCNTNGPLLTPTVYYTLEEHNLEVDSKVAYNLKLRALLEEGLEFNHLTVKQAVGMLDILNGRN